MASNHEIDHKYQNTRDSTSNPSVANEFGTHKDKSIHLVAMQDQDHADIMEELATLVGSNRNTVQGFINDMVGNTNAPTSQSKLPMFEPTLLFYSIRYTDRRVLVAVHKVRTSTVQVITT